MDWSTFSNRVGGHYNNLMDLRIAELRNLGPACERDLNAVGIFSLDDIRRIGIESTYIRLTENKMKSSHGKFEFNANYLYALYGAVHDCDWREVPEAKKIEFKQLTARLRKSHSLKS